MRIKICWIGKTQSAPIRALVTDYLGRLRHLAAVEIVEVPDISKRRRLRGSALLAAEGMELERSLALGGRRVVLDERGREFTSIEFSRWLEGELLRGSCEIAFLIGGPEGVEPSLADHAHLLLSLGRMTWTHEMARALLLEQIYRALAILRNIPYHK